MKEKSLTLITIAAAIVSAVLMIYVAYQGNRAKASISDFGVGVFNFTNQSSKNITHFTESLEDYRKLVNSAERDKIREDYLFRYDILYAATLVLDQYKNETDVTGIQMLVNKSREFVRSIESDMSPDVTLNVQRLDEIIVSGREIYAANYEVANEHFHRHSKLRDDVNDRLKILNITFMVLAALLLTSVVSFLALILKARSQQRRSTQKLVEAHDQLTHVVEELRSGKAERAAQNQFIAAASHDLRQPLHALGLFLNSLEKSVHDEEGRRVLDKIRQSTSALNGLFNGLLDYSKLEAGIVHTEKSHFELSLLLQEIREEFQQSFDSSGITLSVEQSSHILFTDRILLLRIMRNLVSNAIVHAPKATLVIAATKNSEQIPFGSKKINIRIADTGPGIPETEQTAIFSEYYQLNNPERDRNKGLGLGLSIVKKLASLLDVELALNSGLGKGTEILLVVDEGDVLQVERNFPEPNRGLTRHGYGGLRVMVIDDEKDIRDAMQSILTGVNCNVLVADSGEDARMQVVDLDFMPDLVIADYRLRDNKTGCEAVILLREELNGEFPALIVTGDTSPERVRDASESGMRLLHKPVFPEELFRTVDDIIGEYRGRCESSITRVTALQP